MSSPNRDKSGAETSPKIPETTDTPEVNKNKEEHVSTEPASGTSPQVSCNPSVSDDEDSVGELARIKGDAIGDTLYSERFVLSTLLELTKLECINEAIEKDLCALWDMTIEKDVVLLLLEHNVLELFAQCIEATDDKRLTEILVGIIGNMCSVSNARKELGCNTEIIATLLKLISCSDALTLVQLMRVLSVVHIYDDSDAAKLWYKQIHLLPTFVEHFAYILQNSMNITLLTNALEALNAILSKYSVIDILEDSSLTFEDIFVCEPLVCGTFEAFKLLMPSIEEQQNLDTTDRTIESTLPSQALKKTIEAFLNIHVILVQFKETAMNVYKVYLPQLLSILAQMLSPLCSAEYLIPLSNYEQEVIDNVNEIFLALDDPFDENCLSKMITIWEIDQDWISEHRNRPAPANDFEADEEDIDTGNEAMTFAEDMWGSILFFLTRTVIKATSEQLDKTLHKHSPGTIMKLIDALNVYDTTEDIKHCCQKLNETYERLNRVENDADDSVNEQ